LHVAVEEAQFAKAGWGVPDSGEFLAFLFHTGIGKAKKDYEKEFALRIDWKGPGLEGLITGRSSSCGSFRASFLYLERR